MEVLFIVLPLAIAMAGVALGAFFWAVHRGQYDDLDTPRYRALFDEEPGSSTPAVGPDGNITSAERIDRLDTIDISRRSDVVGVEAHRPGGVAGTQNHAVPMG